MERLSSWWRNRGSNKNLEVEEPQKKSSYDVTKEATLGEIKKSEDLLASYQQRLDKEKIEQMEEEKQEVIVRKIYRKKEEGNTEKEKDGKAMEQYEEQKQDKKKEKGHSPVEKEEKNTVLTLD